MRQSSQGTRAATSTLPSQSIPYRAQLGSHCASPQQIVLLLEGLIGWGWAQAQDRTELLLSSFETLRRSTDALLMPVKRHWTVGHWHTEIAPWD